MLVADDAAAQGRAGSVTRILVDAVGTLPRGLSDPSQLPGLVASAVVRRLDASHREDGDPTWLLFAAAFVTRNSVAVCTAGTLRIELLKHGALIHETREHVLANEPLDWVRATYGDIDTVEHATMITRSLGDGSRPAEIRTWDVAPPYVLIVRGTSDHHVAASTVDSSGAIVTLEYRE